MTLRVLLVGNFLSHVAGTRSVIEDLADRLDGRVGRVVRVSAARSGWRRGLHLLAVVLNPRARLDVAVVDVYSGRAFKWAELAALALSRRRVPFVFVLRGGGLPAFAESHATRVRLCLARATAVVAPSTFLLNAMRPYAHAIRLLPNPLDLARYQFRLRRRVEPHLIWLRAFQRMYGPVLAVEVAARLKAEFPALRLTMVGPDKGDGTRLAVERAAEQLGVRDRVDLPGPVAKTDVPAWLQRGDIFLNTTNVDNAPVSVTEALACGLCVVSTDAGGMPDLVADGQSALLVRPNDVQQMADAVRRVLTSAELAERLSHGGRAVVEQLDWALVLPQWLDLLESVALWQSHSHPQQRQGRREAE